MGHPHLHFATLRQCLPVQNHTGREHVMCRTLDHVAVGSGFTRRPGKWNGRPFAWLEDHFLVPRKPHKFGHVVSHTAVYRPNISVRGGRGTGLFVHAVAIPVLTVPRAGSVTANRSHRVLVDRDYDFDVRPAIGAVHCQIPYLGSGIEASTATPPCHLLQARRGKGKILVRLPACLQENPTCERCTPRLVLTPLEPRDRGGIFLVVVPGLPVPKLAVRDFDYALDIHTNTSHSGYLQGNPVDPRGHGGVPGSVNGEPVHRLGRVAHGDERTWDRGARSQ